MNHLRFCLACVSLFWISTVWSCTDIPATECEALTALYQNTQGDTVDVQQVKATISIVSPSSFTGTGVCKPGFNPPQCKAAFFSNDQNVAYQNNGFAYPAVAENNIHDHESIHRPEFVNDGAYGNGTSWISDSQNSWIKIDLGRVLVIDKVIFGRDRLGFFNDRDPGQILISVAISDEVYANGNDNGDENEYVQLFDSKDYNFSGIINSAETLQIYLTPVIVRFI